MFICVPGSEHDPCCWLDLTRKCVSSYWSKWFVQVVGNFFVHVYLKSCRFTLYIAQPIVWLKQLVLHWRLQIDLKPIRKHFKQRKKLYFSSHKTQKFQCVLTIGSESLPAKWTHPDLKSPHKLGQTHLLNRWRLPIRVVRLQKCSGVNGPRVCRLLRDLAASLRASWI